MGLDRADFLKALDVIAGARMLRGASAETLVKVARAARLKSYTRGSMILAQGDAARAIGIVASGWLKLYRVAPNGNEAVVRVFSEGESFGEAVALRHRPYPVSAEAVTDCSVLWLEADQLLHLIRNDPEIAVSLLTSTFVHLHELVSQIEQLKSQNGAQRVAQFLLDLAGQGSGGCTVTLPYDKVLIAAQLGIKPESLSRAFSKLKDHGVVIRNTEADIADVAVLRGFAEEDPGAAWSKRE